jgi:hypothetical protein
MLASLGGTVRTIGFISDYGVHRFHLAGQRPPGDTAIRLGEQGMADFVHDVKEMGVDPDFVSELARKDRSDTAHLTEKRMVERHVTTLFWQT